MTLFTLAIAWASKSPIVHHKSFLFIYFVFVVGLCETKEREGQPGGRWTMLEGAWFDPDFCMVGRGSCFVDPPPPLPSSAILPLLIPLSMLATSPYPFPPSPPPHFSNILTITFIIHWMMHRVVWRGVKIFYKGTM